MGGCFCKESGPPQWPRLLKASLYHQKRGYPEKTQIGFSKHEASLRMELNHGTLFYKLHTSKVVVSSICAELCRQKPKGKCGTRSQNLDKSLQGIARGPSWGPSCNRCPVSSLYSPPIEWAGQAHPKLVVLFFLSCHQHGLPKNV